MPGTLYPLPHTNKCGRGLRREARPALFRLLEIRSRGSGGTVRREGMGRGGAQYAKYGPMPTPDVTRPSIPVYTLRPKKNGSPKSKKLPPNVPATS